MMVVTPTRISVHGRAVPIVLATLAFANEYDVPKRRWMTPFRYWKYCVSQLPCGTPSWISMAWRVAFVTGWPLWANLPRAASTGEPGISRGIRKLSVMAPHRVTTNSSVRRTR